MNWQTLSLRIFDIGVRIHAALPAYPLLHANFSFLSAPEGAPSLEYWIDDAQGGGYVISRADDRNLDAEDASDLLFMVEKAVTLQLQKLRPDLFFLHGAALEYHDQACMLVAPSGSGKSTTAWALLHHGFRYLSDELAPVDVARMEVTPYPHALNLKSDPPPPYTLPNTTLRTGHTLHVPVDALPSGALIAPAPLAAIFFVQYTPAQAQSTLRPLSPAEAGARLYANALNLLAHPAGGIDAGIAIATHCRNYGLSSTNLTQTCELIRGAMENAVRASA